MRRSFASALTSLIAVILSTAGSASAAPNTCIAAKLACTNAYTSAVFKCYATLFKTGFTGKSTDKAEDCVRKARSKFGTALSDQVQCWDKVEAKEKDEKPETVCPLTSFDEYDVDGVVEDFTIDVVNNEVSPGGASSQGNSCSAGKVVCVGNLFKQLFKCEIKAHKEGVATDEACIAKAIARFDGGADPSKGCFAKLEAKEKPGKPRTKCKATGNTAAAGGKAESFVVFTVVGLDS